MTGAALSEARAASRAFGRDRHRCLLEWTRGQTLGGHGVVRRLPEEILDSRFRSVSVSLTVAEAIDTGEVAPLVEELASVIYDAIVGPSST